MPANDLTRDVDNDSGVQSATGNIADRNENLAISELRRIVPVAADLSITESRLVNGIERADDLRECVRKHHALKSCRPSALVLLEARAFRRLQECLLIVYLVSQIPYFRNIPIDADHAHGRTGSFDAFRKTVACALMLFTSPLGHLTRKRLSKTGSVALSDARVKVRGHSLACGERSGRCHSASM
jgi:hypothetical protein